MFLSLRGRIFSPLARSFGLFRCLRFDENFLQRFLLIFSSLSCLEFLRRIFFVRRTVHIFELVMCLLGFWRFIVNFYRLPVANLARLFDCFGVTGSVRCWSMTLARFRSSTSVQRRRLVALVRRGSLIIVTRFTVMMMTIIARFRPATLSRTSVYMVITFFWNERLLWLVAFGPFGALVLTLKFCFQLSRLSGNDTGTRRCIGSWRTIGRATTNFATLLGL